MLLATKPKAHRFCIMLSAFQYNHLLIMARTETIKKGKSVSMASIVKSKVFNSKGLESKGLEKKA